MKRIVIIPWKKRHFCLEDPCRICIEPVTIKPLRIPIYLIFFSVFGSNIFMSLSKHDAELLDEEQAPPMGPSGRDRPCWRGVP